MAGDNAPTEGVRSSGLPLPPTIAESPPQGDDDRGSLAALPPFSTTADEWDEPAVLGRATSLGDDGGDDAGDSDGAGGGHGDGRDRITEADTFPIDAFIIPDDTDRLPEGVGVNSMADQLAERLEELAAELRTDGEVVLQQYMEKSGRLDALLGAILIGYLAARSEGD